MSRAQFLEINNAYLSGEISARAAFDRINSLTIAPDTQLEKDKLRLLEVVGLAIRQGGLSVEP